MTVSNPTQLVDEFKKAGEFDRLRRDLLRQFQRGDGMPAFTARIEDIARQRLVSDQKLLLLSHDALHRELMQEVDRYPIVERAVADVRTLTDPTFAAAIHASAQRILAQDRTKAPVVPAPSSDSEQPLSCHPNASALLLNQRNDNIKLECSDETKPGPVSTSEIMLAPTPSHAGAQPPGSPQTVIPGGANTTAGNREDG